MINRLLLNLVVLFTLFGCTPYELTREDLHDFIADPSNGLSKSVNAGDYTITCAYQPADLVFSNELATENHLGQKRDSLMKAYQRVYYFRLSISRRDKSIEQFFAQTPERLAELTSYLSSTIGKDLQMQSGGSTTNLVDFVYVPFYGSSSTTQILLAFELKQGISEEIKIIYQDSFVGFGRTEFLFKAEDLRKTPLLKFDN
jgi:hypothetical protein